jgi:hypothetical protein
MAFNRMMEATASSTSPLEQARTLVQGLITVSDLILANMAIGQSGKASLNEADFERLDATELNTLMQQRGDLLEQLASMAQSGQLTQADDDIAKKLVHLGMLDKEVEAIMDLIKQSIEHRLNTLGQNKTMLDQYAAFTQTSNATLHDNHV